MFIPSEFLMLSVRSQKQGVWVASTEDSVALILKVPTVVAKALAKGSEAEFFSGFTEYSACYAVVAIRIMDSNDAPYFYVSPVMSFDNFGSICRISQYESVSITVFDEFDNPCCFATSSLSETFKAEIAKTFFNIKKPMVFDDPETIELVIDSFFQKLIPDYCEKVYFDVRVVGQRLMLRGIKTLLILDGTNHGVINYEIGKGDEGRTQEEQLKHFLTIIFGSGTHLSPWKTRDRNTDELVDVLAISARFNLLVSSKATSLNDTSHIKAYSRRASGLTSHAYGAFKQLFGAIKSLKRNEPVRTHSDKIIIDINRSLPCHGIAIISEFYSENIDWRECINFANQIHQKTGAKIHLLSLSDFIYILKLSKESIAALNKILDERFEVFIDKQNFDILSTDPTLPMHLS